MYHFQHGGFFFPHRQPANCQQVCFGNIQPENQQHHEQHQRLRQQQQRRIDQEREQSLEERRGLHVSALVFRVAPRLVDRPFGVADAPVAVQVELRPAATTPAAPRGDKDGDDSDDYH